MITFHDNEKAIVSVRKHWLVFIIETFGLFIAIVFPFFILPFIDNIFSSLGPKTNIVILFVLFAWELAIWMTFFTALTNYYLDMLVITNKRVLDVDQIGLFSRDLATVPIKNIQDVKIEIKGIIATLFGYGNIHIQTAGSAPEVIIRGIKKPKMVKDMILRINHEYAGQEEAGDIKYSE